MPSCILRVAKLKTAGNIVGSGRHNYRESQTDNADPTRTPNNTTTGAQSSAELLAGVQARLKTVSHVRENAVLALEYFIGASPEFFAVNKFDGTKKTTLTEEYFNQAEKWLIEKHGKENIIAITRQYDETSPHICAYVVPIDERGKLNASKFLDGRKKLSELQTDFANQCGLPFGLARGIEGSKAKHTSISEYYSVVNSKTPEVTSQIPEDRRPTFAENLMISANINNDYSELQKKRKEATTKRADEEKRQRIAEQAKAKQLDLDRAANGARDAALAELRASSAQLREIPLPDVLKHLGCRPDPTDPNNWVTRAGRLTVDGRKFYLHDAGSGGGGAIDLVKMVEETDYKGAVRILADGFGTGAVVSHELARAKANVEQIVLAPAVFVPPVPSPEHWPKVKDYLTNTRKLAVDFIDKLHRNGAIYADKFANAVFVLAGGRGVALRGTGGVKFHGVRGEKVPFFLTAEPSKSQQVAFTESAIDAISLRQLGFPGEIIATSGQAGNLVNSLADLYRARGVEVIAAFDDDKAGNKMCDEMGQPQTRIRPRGGAKDWNAEVMSGKPSPPLSSILKPKQHLVSEYDAFMGKLSPSTVKESAPTVKELASRGPRPGGR
jgi:hypothetical protein